MFGGTLTNLRPSELLILLKDRDGELLLTANGKPPLQVYLEEGKITCARLGFKVLAWDELVATLSELYAADEIAFLYRRGVRPQDCAVRFDVPADRLVSETLTYRDGRVNPAS